MLDIKMINTNEEALQFIPRRKITANKLDKSIFYKSDITCPGMNIFSSIKRTYLIHKILAVIASITYSNMGFLRYNFRFRFRRNGDL